MAIILSSREDKNKIIDMIFTVVKELTYHGLDHGQKVDVATLFANIRQNGQGLVAGCRLEGDPTSGREKIKVVLELSNA